MSSAVVHLQQLAPLDAANTRILWRGACVAGWEAVSARFGRSADGSAGEVAAAAATNTSSAGPAPTWRAA